MLLSPFMVLILALGFSQGAAGADCMPNHVVNSYLDQHPDWALVTLRDLQEDDRRLWLDHHLGNCPGLAEAEIFGSKRKSIGLALIRRTENHLVEKAVLLTVSPERREIELEKATVVPSPLVIWQLGPGTYSSFEGKAFKLENDSIMYEKIESRATQFYTSGGKLKSFLASD